ncbi:MAG: pectinesterase family protein [Candidatus Thermoplasmatota archaeon]|nr:pectinesterase family protein [Candidatus Thermoplasmatota archaeon]
MNMDRWLQGLFLVFIIAVAGSFGLVTADEPASSGATIYVNGTGGADFTSIQAAIDNASAGDTIVVQAGVYRESLVVAKALNLTGDGASSTIVDGGQQGHVIAIRASGVLVSGLTFRNSSQTWRHAGLLIQGNHTRISGCNATGNYNGIHVNCTHHVYLDNCTLTDNQNDDLSITCSSNVTVEGCTSRLSPSGVVAAESRNVTVSRCTISDHHMSGIFANASNHLTVQHCIIGNNSRGLRFYATSSSLITGCEFSHNSYGIFLEADSSQSVIYGNNFIDNVHQAEDECVNTWDDGSSGNYWSDFDEPSEGAWDNDTDGIIDHPYLVSGDGNQDRYPLAQPLDLYPPVTEVSVTGPTGDGGWYTGPANVTLTAVDNDSAVDHTYYSLDGSGWEEYTASFTISTEGPHRLDFYSTDVEGNAEPVKTVMVNIDTQPPEITCYLEPAAPDGDSGWYTGNVEVTLVAWDNASTIRRIQYRLNQDTWMDYTGYFIITEEGNHTFSYSATDAAGHRVTKSTRIKIDKNAPAVNLTPPATDYVKGTVAVNWTATDTVDPGLDGSITLDLVQGNHSTTLATGLNSTGTYLWNTQAHPDGTYQLRITATDEAGNTGTNTSLSFILDNTPPAVIIDQPRGGEVLGGDYKTLRIFWNATDTVDSNLDGTIWISYSSDNGETWVDMVKGASNSGEFTYGIQAWDNGNYRLRINATDDAGNTGSAVSANFTIDKDPPTVEITNPDPGYLYINLLGRDIIPPIPISFIPRPLGFLPTTVVIGQVTVTASASDEFSDISRVEIRAGDTTQVFDTTPYRFEWIPAIGMGECTVVATARDLAGNTATDTLTGIFCINI